MPTFASDGLHLFGQVLSDGSELWRWVSCVSLSLVKVNENDRRTKKSVEKKNNVPICRQVRRKAARGGI